MRKGIKGFNKELTNLHPILSPSPSIKYEKFKIPHPNNKRKHLVLWKNNRVDIPSRMRKGIEGFNKELTGLHLILSSLSWVLIRVN